MLLVQALDDGEYMAFTGGVKHGMFWSLNGGTLKGKKALFGRMGPQTITCSAVVGGQLITGSTAGQLLVWAGNTVSKAIDAHKGSVYDLWAHAGGLVSGGKDGLVKMWTPSLEVSAKPFDMAEANPPSMSPIVRSVSLSSDGSVLLVGTLGSEVYEVSSAATTTLSLPVPFTAIPSSSFLPFPLRSL